MPSYLPTDTLDTADGLDFTDQLNDGLSSVQFAGALTPALHGLQSIASKWKQSGPRPLSTDNQPMVTAPLPDVKPIQTVEQLQQAWYGGNGDASTPSQDTSSVEPGGTPTASGSAFSSAPAGGSPSPAGAQPSAVPTGQAPGADDPWGQKAYAAAVAAGHPNPAEFVEQMRWESGNFDPNVISGKRSSSAGAQGIAQIMPQTAAGWNVNPLDPDAALAAAARAMAGYYQKYNGNSEQALAAYNMGEGNLQKYGARGLPETNKYIDIIHQRTGTASGPGGAQPIPTAPNAPQTNPTPSANAPTAPQTNPTPLPNAPTASAAAPISYDDMVTVRTPDGKTTLQVPRGMVGEGPGKYAPSKGWTVVGDPSQPVAQAQTTGGPPWEQTQASQSQASTSATSSQAASSKPLSTPPSSSDLMLRQPLGMATSGPDTFSADQFPSFQDSQTEADRSAPWGALPSSPPVPGQPDPEASRNETVPGLSTPQDVSPDGQGSYGQIKGMIDRRNYLVPNDLPPDVYQGNASPMTDASPLVSDASAPSPAPASSGAGAFQDDQTDSGRVSPGTPGTNSGYSPGIDNASPMSQQIPNEDQTSYPPAPQPNGQPRIVDTSGPDQGPPAPAQSPFQPLYDLAGNIKGYVDHGAQAVADSKPVQDLTQAASQAAQASDTNAATRNARLEQDPRRLAFEHALQQGLLPNLTNIEDFLAQTGLNPQDLNRAVDVARGVLNAMPEATSDTLDAALGTAGLDRQNVGLDTPFGRLGLADALPLLPLPGKAGAVMQAATSLGPLPMGEAATGPAAGRIAGALENVGDRAATAVRGAVGAGFNAASDAVRSGIEAGRSLIHAPDPEGVPNAGIWFSKPDGSAFTPEEVQQTQASLASRGIQAHLASDGTTIVIPAHDAPPGFVTHVTGAVKEAGYGPQDLTSYAGETRSEVVGDRPAGAPASGDQSGQANGPTLSERGPSGVGTTAADSAGARGNPADAGAGGRGLGDEQSAGAADALPNGRPTAAPLDQGNNNPAVQRGPEPAAVGPQRGRSTATYGVFGVAPPEAGSAAADVARPRFVPPEVRMQTTPVMELPDDPRFAQAVEAHGGRITDQGAEVYVTRAQGPDAAGKTATRGGVFGEVVPENGRSSFANNITNDPTKVGGTQVLPPTKTLYRKPIVLDSEPGSSQGFDQAMQKLTAQVPQQAEVDAAQAEVARTWAVVKSLEGGPKPPRDAAFAEFQAANRRLREAQNITVSSADIDKATKEAQRAGPPGSPERAQALKDLVSKYGGDPSTIDDLLKIRASDASESQWAIKENIVAGNARRAGVDGVFTVKEGERPTLKAIQETPEVAQTQQASDQAYQAFRKARDAYDTLRFRAFGGGDARDVDWAIQQATSHPNAEVRTAMREKVRAVQTDPEYQAAKQKMQETSNVYDQASDAYNQAYERAAAAKPAIKEVFDVQQGRNPTPGTPDPLAVRTQARLQEQLAQGQAAWDKWQETAYAPGHTITPDEKAAVAPILKQISDAERGLELLKGVQGGPPGYSLHPDLVRPTAPEAAGSTTAAGTAGVVPIPMRTAGDVGASVAASKGFFDKATPLLSQGLASAVSGGVGAATAQQLGDPNDPNRALKGFAVGAVAPYALSRGAAALARRAGRETPQAEGALMALGQAPGGGQPPQNLPPQVQQAVQRGQAQQQPGRTGLDWMQYWARRWGGAVSNASLLGPTAFVAKGTGDLAQALIAQPRQAAVAIARGAPEEYPQFLAGTFNALNGLGTQILDTIAARGAHANPQSLSSELQNQPALKGLATMLEMGARAGIGVPTTIFHALAEGGATQLRAAQAATDAVRAGQIPQSDWQPLIHAIMADVDQVRAGGQPNLPMTQGVIDSSKDYAAKQTFTNEVGPIGQFVKRAASVRVWGPQHNEPIPIVSNFLLPYFNVPWNLKAALAEHSPVGLAQGISDVVQGKGTQIERTEKVFNGMLGSAVLAGMGVYATNGGVTGKGPSDPNELQNLKNTGWQPYSTLVNGVYVPNRLVWQFAEPAANMAGDIHDAMAFRAPGSPVQSLPVLGDAVHRLGADLMKDSFLQPLADGLSMMDTAAHGSPATGIARFAASQVDRFAVPYASTFRTAGAIMDPSSRVADRGPNAPFSTQFEQNARLGVGNRQGFSSLGEGPLPVAQNRYGQPVPNEQQGILSAASRLSPQRSDPLSQFYSGYTHNLGASPSRIPVNGTTIPLTPDQQRTWEQYRGQQLDQARLALQSDRYWQTASPADRDKIIQNQFSMAGTAATNRIKADIGPAALTKMIEDAKRQPVGAR